MPGVKVLGAWSLPKDVTSTSGNVGWNTKSSKIGNGFLGRKDLEVSELWFYILGIHTR